MVAWASPMARGAEGWGDVSPLRQLLDKTDKPVVGFGRVIHQLGADHVAVQKATGFPFLQGIEPTIRALNGLWFHAARQGRMPAAPQPAPPSELSPATLMATLARYGILLPRSETVASVAEAAAAAQRIGFPVALKIDSRDIAHKTEIGGVALDLRDRVAFQSAAESLAERARAAVPHARIDGFLVQEMIAGIEAIVGARSDPLYGPMLLIGSRRHPGRARPRQPQYGCCRLRPARSARWSNSSSSPSLLPGFAAGRPPIAKRSKPRRLRSVSSFSTTAQGSARSRSIH